jgi:acyl-CoA synthetase (AMP-forming)/AMP-acid ligase II
MKGYWNLPEVTGHTFVDGWFSTGDIGRVDEDGYFFIVARRNIWSSATDTTSIRARWKMHSPDTSP